MDFSLIDIVLHLDDFLITLVAQYGVWIYAILFLVVFCETGLIVTPFLPGDSLLFVAGAISATGGMDPLLLSAVLILAACMGDSTNYWIGRRAGGRLFSRPESRLFRRDYLQQAEAFYARHGGKTVAMARFLPIVRTFAPFVAGMAHMPYPRFLAFSIGGSVLWVSSLITLGYLFGNVPIIRDNLSALILLIIGLSVSPLLLRTLRSWMARRSVA